VAYRERTIQAARDRAAANGYRGTQFPWESAFSGEEMTPEWAETRDFQLHITADVAIGQWWYYLNTGDLDWLRAHGFPVIRECAEFWTSRVEYNAAHDRYEISDVVCADEYAAHVDNDAFTNAAVRKALLIAERAAHLLGEPAQAEWRIIAEKIYIPYDADSRRHLEFDGYDGRVTKQADVELLAFPLEYVRDRDQIARDLDYYARVIDPNGPAMSFSVYAILSAQLGRAREAYEYLERSYVPNTRPPFQAFSETPTNNEFLFCTGVGGALQAFLFGFTGLRLREGFFVLNPLLPEPWEALRLHNLYIAGARTDIEIIAGRLVVRRKLPDSTLTVDLSRADGQMELAASDDASRRVTVELVDESGTTSSCVTIGSGERAPLPGSLDDGLRLRVGPEGAEYSLDLLLVQPRLPGRPPS
jgi:trehalose/maltose hydrolase-like predicted phosphorylase